VFCESFRGVEEHTHGWNVAIAIDRAGSVDDKNCWKLTGVFITVVTVVGG
jgi:hypothetical protein